MLVWADEKGAEFLQRFLGRILEGETPGPKQRQIAATLSFVQQAVSSKRFAPPGLVDKMLGIKSA